MKKSLFGGIFLLGLLVPLFAEVVMQNRWEVSSPNLEHSIVIEREGSSRELNFFFSLYSADQKIIQKGKLVLDFYAPDHLSQFDFIQATERKVHSKITPEVPTFSNKLTESFKELSLEFSSDLFLVVQAHDEGVAFRWEMNNAEEWIIRQETIEFAFSKNYLTWYPDPLGVRFFSHQEPLYHQKKLSQIGTNDLAPVPFMVELENQRYLLISDLNLQNYPGLWVRKKQSSSLCLEAQFPPYPLKTNLVGDRSWVVTKEAPYMAKIPAAQQGEKNFTSWKAFKIGKIDSFFNSALFYLLSTETSLKERAWIQPGLVVWDWWNANNLQGVDFKAGINQETYRYNIDFASENKIPYVILDEGWSLAGPQNLLKVNPDIDIAELSAYANSKKVGLILWMTSAALEANFETAFEQFKAWGIKGIKIDFMQRDDQPMMEFCYKAAKKAAEYQLVVDFHGGSKPVGIQRTYPNVLTIESVAGLEQSKWCFNANPDRAVTLAYLRMAIGPMDYTPGAMRNAQRGKFRPLFTTPMSQGTRAHQLAMYVVYLSPLQMLADTAVQYRKNPTSLNFIKKVPTSWDETLFLSGSIDSYVALARRKGKVWYVGALGNWKEHSFFVDLSFLPKGEYEIVAYCDGKKASQKGSDLTIKTFEMKILKEQPALLEIHLATGGGFAAVIKKK